MKTFKYLTLIITLAAAQANAATFVTGDLTNGFVGANGTTPLASASVRYGTFADGFNFSANANDLAALEAAFTQVITYNGAFNVAPGVFNLTNLTYNEGGTFEGVPYDLSANTSNVGGDIAGSTVYAWVLNNTNPSLATEHAVFSRTGSVWTDAQTIPVNSTSFSWATTTGAEVTAHIGTVLGGANIGGSANAHSLAAIPEPSRAMLGFIGFAAMLFRRRRA